MLGKELETLLDDFIAKRILEIMILKYNTIINVVQVMAMILNFLHIVQTICDQPKVIQSHQEYSQSRLVLGVVRGKGEVSDRYGTGTGCLGDYKGF